MYLPAPHNGGAGSVSRNLRETTLQRESGPAPHAPLSERIRHRIARRLQDRVRDLEVVVRDDKIVLRGRCSTYYSKQLAQHAALGAIENEQLENDIEVAVAR